MFFITLNFKRLINYHIDTLCRVEKFAGKCHNVFRTDLVDDTVEIAGVIELGMGAVVKLQVFRPVGHILFGKRLLVFLFKHQQIVFGVIFGDTFLYELPDLVVDLWPASFRTARQRSGRRTGNPPLPCGVVPRRNHPRPRG